MTTHIETILGPDGSATAVTSTAASFSAARSGFVCGFFVDLGSQNALTSVTDDQGNTYTLITAVVDSTNNGCVQLFYKEDVKNVTTITANFSSSSQVRIAISNYTGIVPSAAIDGHTGQVQTTPGTGANIITTGAFTTTANGDLIYGGCSQAFVGGAIVYTAGTSPNAFTQRASNGGGDNDTLFTEDFIQLTAGSIAATMGQSSNVTTMSAVAAFKAAVAGGISLAKQNFKIDKFKTPFQSMGPNAGLFQVKAYPVIPAGQVPFRQTDWPLPQASEPYPYRSFEWGQNRKLLIGQDALPFRQRDWPLPDRTEPWPYRSFEWDNRQILTGQDKLPFRQFDWPLSVPADTPDARRSWASSYNLNLIGKDQLPFRQFDWPLPVAPEPDWRRAWTLSLLQTTLTPVIVMPFRQTDWPLPIAAEPDPRRSWSSGYNLNLIGQDQLPFRQTDWPLPVAPEPDARRSATGSYNLNLIGQDLLPFRQTDWPLPLPASTWQAAPTIPNLVINLPPPPAGTTVQLITSMAGFFNPGASAIP